MIGSGIKIALCFYGVNRSLSITHASIKERVISPWCELGQVDVYGSFMHTEAGLVNRRSGELGVHLERDSVALLPFDGLLFVDQDRFDQEVGLSRLLEGVPDYYGDSHSSTRNIFRSLYALRQSYQMAAARHRYDCVLFLRADLFYIDRFDAAGMLQKLSLDSRRVLTPVWQQWGGLNDRLAVCTPAAAEVFAERVEQILDFCRSTREPIQAERLLLWFCLRNGIHFDRFIDERAVRVRATGVFREEQFQETGIAPDALMRYTQLVQAEANKR